LADVGSLFSFTFYASTRNIKVFQSLTIHFTPVLRTVKSGASSGRLRAMSERRTLPIGETVGTLAVMFAMVLTEAGDALRLMSKSEPCREIFSVVGTSGCSDPEAEGIR